MQLDVVPGPASSARPLFELPLALWLAASPFRWLSGIEYDRRFGPRYGGWDALAKAANLTVVRAPRRHGWAGEGIQQQRSLAERSSAIRRKLRD